MNYKEFNKTFNKRDSKGVVVECSVITLKGEVIFKGSVEEVDNFMDENTEVKWQNGKFLGNFVDDEKVVTTNIGENDSYGKYIMSQLQF